MPANRTVQTGGVWADGAVDVVGSPIVGTTYKDSALLAAAIEAGWPFKEIVDSSKINEVLYRLTTMALSQELWGQSVYCADIIYGLNAIVMGSDGVVYVSISAANQGNDPTSSPTKWSKAHLGYTEKAADSDKLDGQHGSYFAPLASPALTGSPTAPTQTAGDSSTKLATTAFVAGVGASLAKRFVSAPFTWVAGTKKTYAHGLTGTPFNARVVAKCLSAEYGHAVGEWAFHLGETAANTLSQMPASVYIDGANIYYHGWQSAPYIQNITTPSTISVVSLTPANWDLYLIAEFI